MSSGFIHRSSQSRKRLVAIFFVASIAIEQSTNAADVVSPIPKTGSLVFKQEPRRKLIIYYPDNWKAADKRSALVIFRCRIPYQREHFRKRGMVIIKPDTAPVNSGKLPGMTLEDIAASPKPRDQVADTKSAIRFIRQNAAKLGIDPNKIVATGTSGGGDLALQSHLNRAFEDPQDDRSVSPSPNALVLYCPAFDGIDIWFVKNATLLERTKAEAPSYIPLLSRFIRNTTDEYAQPLDHRAKLIELTATLGAEKNFPSTEIKAFQSILELFNNRDWQLLHPAADAMKMSASRILTKEPLPPTFILHGDRDHLLQYQTAFVRQAKAMGQEFDLKIYKGGGHSFMMQPAFEKPSTADVDAFLVKKGFLPAE